MAERPSADESAGRPPPKTKRRSNLRRLLRALHRDIGYALVGLTFVYALSGLAVNHVEDWDPSFSHVERVHEVALGADQDEAVAAARRALEIDEEPTEVYAITDTEIEVSFERRTLHLDLDHDRIREEAQEPRFLLRAANWLHLNRGKRAWTYVADAFAVLLLFLATSGLFMLPGRKGLIGRGGVLLLLGAAIPVLYVVMSSP